MKPDDYRRGEKYQKPDRYGWTSIPILEFLWGQPWDELALNYVHAVQPSHIRVVPPNCGIACDQRCWRVTVHLDQDDKTIKNIIQEVEVALEGCENGHDLHLKLRKRLGNECKRIDTWG